MLHRRLILSCLASTLAAACAAGGGDGARDVVQFTSSCDPELIASCEAEPACDDSVIDALCDDDTANDCDAAVDLRCALEGLSDDACAALRAEVCADVEVSDNYYDCMIRITTGCEERLIADDECDALVEEYCGDLPPAPSDDPYPHCFEAMEECLGTGATEEECARRLFEAGLCDDPTGTEPTPVDCDTFYADCVEGGFDPDECKEEALDAGCDV